MAARGRAAFAGPKTTGSDLLQFQQIAFGITQIDCQAGMVRGPQIDRFPQPCPPFGQGTAQHMLKIADGDRKMSETRPVEFGQARELRAGGIEDLEERRVGPGKTQPGAVKGNVVQPEAPGKERPGEGATGSQNAEPEDRDVETGQRRPVAGHEIDMREARRRAQKNA